MKKLSISNSAPAFTAVALNTNYDSLKGIKWFENRNKHEMIAVPKKLEKYVTYNEDGNFIEVELAIEISALPVSAIEYLKKYYKTNAIKEVSEIVAADGTVSYKAELKRVDIYFDSYGCLDKLRKNQD